MRENKIEKEFDIKIFNKNDEEILSKKVKSRSRYFVKKIAKNIFRATEGSESFSIE